MKNIYKTHGVCSSCIEIDVEDGMLREVAYRGGRPTSCPDRLCQALHGMGY